MSQNITQRSKSNNQLLASMMLVKVSKHEIEGLVSWATSSGKVSYWEASMVVEVSVIHTAIKLGLIAELEAKYGKQSQIKPNNPKQKHKFSLYSKDSEIFDHVVMGIETEQEILSFLKNLINYRQDYLANAIPPELIN